jgi:AraC family transcriptional regulator
MAGVLAIHLAGHYGRSEVPRAPNAGLAPHKLNRVLALIQARIAEPIHVRELAVEAHLSLYHFARLFKQAAGQPPHAYITRQRMEHAKSLLRNSSLSLVEVAASVGYQSQAHFTGVFHQYIGVTPRAFRVNAQAARPGH